MTHRGLRLVDLLFCVLASFLLPSSGFSQSSGVEIGGTLKPLSDSLRDRGIDLSEPSFVAALHNDDAEVRSFAALKLAEDHDFDAVSSIAGALSIEANGRTRIGMAEALWGLNDRRGVAYLQAMCLDNSLPLNTIVEVVQHLSIIGQSSATCIDPVLGHLGSEDDMRSRRQTALPVLPDLYRWASQLEADRIVRLLEQMLADREPAIRMEASHALVRIGSHSSSGRIRNAVTQESDVNVRLSLQKDLDSLEKQP